jgi:hypothetical protein
MNYCTHFDVNYSYTTEGLFIEVNGKTKYMPLNMKIPADFTAFTLMGPNVLDIGDSVYIIRQDRVYKYDLDRIRYANGRFLVETADGIFSVDSDGLKKPLADTEKILWQAADKIKNLNVMSIFGETDFERAKKNRSAVYKDGRKKFIMELKEPV